MIRIVKSPWQNVFVDLLGRSQEKVYLASPFIKRQTAGLIADTICKGKDFRYINSFKLANFHRGASDLEALRILHGRGFKQKNVHNLHAKLFIFDNEAVITSGNLTPGGLRNNLEYGVLLQGNLVEEITGDYLKIFEDPENPYITTTVINKAENILRSVPREGGKGMTVADEALFEEMLNDENVEEKFDGGTKSIISNLTSWKKDVFECLLEVQGNNFTVENIYSFEKRLQRRHPNNRNIRPKIRQQLQYLRDIGLVEFTKPGQYKKLWI